MKSHTAFWTVLRLAPQCTQHNPLDNKNCPGKHQGSIHYSCEHLDLPPLHQLKPPEPNTPHITVLPRALSAMAARLVLLVMMAMVAGSDGAWCVCRTDMPDNTLQKTLDYACGDGADCKPILQNGGCFNPDTVKSHCSYAVNSFYQRNAQNPQACVFSGTATLTNTDPSYSGCQFPATASAAGTSTPTSPGTVGTGGMPGVYSPPGAGMGGLGPSGNSFDNSGADGVLPATGMAKQIVILAFCSLMVMYFRM